MMDPQIRKVTSTEEYAGLRDLWCRVFGDEPEFVDAFYRRFGADLSFSEEKGEIAGYVICDDGRVVSALTLYRCGTMYIPDPGETMDEEDPVIFPDREFAGLPVYVTYAVCTDPGYRGRGYAGRLTEHVKKTVTEDLRALSVVSPAEPELEDYYGSFGYEKGFFAFEGKAFSDILMYDEDMFDDDDDFDAFDPGLSVVSAGAALYNRYREAFLSGRPHIEPSKAMLRLMESESMDGCGLCSINRGDAICVISEAGPARVVLTELILNPVLEELSMGIDAEIAAMIAKHFDAAETVYITPGPGGCQGMVCGLTPEDDGPYHEDGSAGFTEEPYYGFPVQ